MLTIACLKLALVVVQVVTQPPPFTMGASFKPGFIWDEDTHQIQSVPLPFEMTNPDHVAQGDLYQSDILLTKEQWASLRQRKAINSQSSRWTEGNDGNPLVPYVFQDDVDKDDVRDGLDHWMEHTCIKFEETSDTNQPHLQFHIGSGCWSYIGMIGAWNGQEISIGSGCNNLGTVVHEVGHAIGFFHEQSRSDRDDHVVILSENIQEGKEGNFDKSVDDNHGVTYDYSSNMHYGLDYFTKNGQPTIVTKNPMAQELSGSRNGLTHRDKLLANRMYGCLDKWLSKCSKSSDPCQNDGYLGVDCDCVCPPGTSDSKCETITADYYDHLKSDKSEKISAAKEIEIKTPMSAGETFVKWIVPPTCKIAKLTFTEENMYTGDCYFQSVNIRTDPTDYSGVKLCRDDVANYNTYTSETEIIVTMSNRVSYSLEKTLWKADVSFEDITGCSDPDSTIQPPTTNTANPTTTVPLTTTKVPATTKPPTTTANPLTTEPPTTTNAPTTTKPPTTTDSPTTTTIPQSTTESPQPPNLGCSKRPRKKTLSKGQKFTLTSPGYPEKYSTNKIKCGWKLKAKRSTKLHITCGAFQLSGRDVLKINRKYFKQDNIPPTRSSKWFGITFLSRKRSSGPGFSCVVKAL